MNRIVRRSLLLCLLAAPMPASAQAAPADPFAVQRGDRIVFVGNTFAERMSLFPHFEAELTTRFAGDSLTFRNLGWSADELTLQPRPLNFGDMHTHLAEQRADVIFAFFGMNESFKGADSLPKFRADLAAFLQGLTGRQFNGTRAPRVVLVSPIAQERIARIPVDTEARNRDLALYSAAMKEVAAQAGVRFVDLFTPTRTLLEDPALGDLTINGIHPNDAGYRLMSHLMMVQLGLREPREVGAVVADLARCDTAPRGSPQGRLHAAVREKNDLFFYRWRAVNGEYIYGRRKEPFGVVNFPAEMRQLEDLIRGKERDIWALAKSQPATARAAGGGCVARAR